MGEITIDWEEGTYTGEVSSGVPNGQGTFTYPDGSKYVGEFKDGKIVNGQGTYTHPDGSKYVGEFKNDKKDGQGFDTDPDGSTYFGEFKNGNLWNGTEYDKDGNVTATWSDGVMTEK